MLLSIFDPFKKSHISSKTRWNENKKIKSNEIYFRLPKDLLKFTERETKEERERESKNEIERSRQKERKKVNEREIKTDIKK